MYRILGVLIVLLLAPLGVSAQTAEATTPEERAKEMQEMRARIEKLEKLVAELQKEKEAKSSAPAAEVAAAAQPAPPASPAAAEHTAPIPQGEYAGGQVNGANVAERKFPALHFRGFADVDFGATDEPGAKSGFTLGQFILHVSSPLSSKVSVFGEVSFTAQAAATGAAYFADIERSIIRYDYNDYFKISFGRYHTPINYWNTAFHHGLWLQTTIARPELIRFGGRFQPVHFVGMLAEGNIPSGPVGLGYNVGLGNGRAGNIARPGDAGDVNNNRAWVVNLFSRPTALAHLQVGGAVYGDEATPSPALQGNPSCKELITSAQIVWTKENPEILAEFAHVRHRNELTQNVFNSQAAYVQVAYRLWGEGHKWKPYYRFEWSNINQSDPLFNVPDLTVAVRNLTGSTVGVRYDITNLAAFKGEYRHVKRLPTDPIVNGVFFQTSFTF